MCPLLVDYLLMRSVLDKKLDWKIQLKWELPLKDPRQCESLWHHQSKWCPCNVNLCCTAAAMARESVRECSKTRTGVGQEQPNLL